jgi:hypothetical protein
MPDVAWSTATVAALLDPATGILIDPRWSVHDGAAPTGVNPPFVAVWPLIPDRLGQGLCLEDWGQLLDRWQLSCVGVSASQAAWLVRTVTALAWPAGWELVDVGILAADPEPAPSWWMQPVVMRHTVTV